MKKEEVSPRWVIEGPRKISGTVSIDGAKNGVLVTLSSLLLTKGLSILRNVPPLTDVLHMSMLLERLGAVIAYDVDQRIMRVDTTGVSGELLDKELYEQMYGMRAASLLLGPLLARYGAVRIGVARGCFLGARPLDFHIRAFVAMGAHVDECSDGSIELTATQLRPSSHCLEYPSVGATENIMLAAASLSGETRIDNAAIEPEVIDLAKVLRMMGAEVEFSVPGTIFVRGNSRLNSIDHIIPPDRLEAGTWLIAAAATGGVVTIPDIQANDILLVLNKLSEMGHVISIGPSGKGVTIVASERPRAVSFRTMPYPGFPTDLQAPMMVAQLVATGKSHVMETVFENRLTHVKELQLMGATIELTNRLEASVIGGLPLVGARVCAPNIRGGAALAIAACVAEGLTELTGIEHISRGYVDFVKKLCSLGGAVDVVYM